jgi:hypothetical protein
VAFNREAELLGELLVAPVVVGARAAGVLNLAGRGEAVGRLVQQRAEHVDGFAREALAADEQLGHRGGRR